MFRQLLQLLSCTERTRILLLENESVYHFGVMFINVVNSLHFESAKTLPAFVDSNFNTLLCLIAEQDEPSSTTRCLQFLKTLTDLLHLDSRRSTCLKLLEGSAIYQHVIDIHKPLWDTSVFSTQACFWSTEMERLQLNAQYDIRLVLLTLQNLAIVFALQYITTDLRYLSELRIYKDTTKHMESLVSVVNLSRSVWIFQGDNGYNTETRLPKFVVDTFMQLLNLRALTNGNLRRVSQLFAHTEPCKPMTTHEIVCRITAIMGCSVTNTRELQPTHVRQVQPEEIRNWLNLNESFQEINVAASLNERLLRNAKVVVGLRVRLNHDVNENDRDIMRMDLRQFVVCNTNSVKRLLAYWRDVSTCMTELKERLRIAQYIVMLQLMRDLRLTPRQMVLMKFRSRESRDQPCEIDLLKRTFRSELGNTRDLSVQLIRDLKRLRTYMRELHGRGAPFVFFKYDVGSVTRKRYTEEIAENTAKDAFLQSGMTAEIYLSLKPSERKWMRKENGGKEEEEESEENEEEEEEKLTEKQTKKQRVVVSSPEKKSIADELPVTELLNKVPVKESLVTPVTELPAPIPVAPTSKRKRNECDFELAKQQLAQSFRESFPCILPEDAAIWKEQRTII